MKLPDLDPTGGKLEMSAVLIEYDGPQLFVAKNSGGALFLALHGPPPKGGDLWIFARTSRYRINQLASGQISLRSAMIEFARGDIAIAIIFDDRWEFEFRSPNEVPEKYLPEVNSFIRSANLPEFHKAASTIYVEDDDFNLPIPVYKDMWEFDPQTIEYFKENITPLPVVAHRRQRLVADIILADGESKHDISIPDLSKILMSLQKTVDSLAGSEQGEDWKPSKGSKSETRLDAIATFPSSFGLRIEAHTGALADQSAGSLAFQRLIDLLTSINNIETLRSSFLHHNTATKLQFGKFVEYIAKSGNSIKVSASTGMSPRVETATVSRETLSDVYARIQEINDTEYDDLEIKGRLKAVSLKTKFFLIENEEESISGRIDESLLPAISGMAIDEVYVASIRIHHEIHELTGEITSKAKLLSLHPVTYRYE